MATGLSPEGAVKRCCGCKVEKPLNDFSRSADKPDGRYPVCKTCKSARLRAAYHADVEASRARATEYRNANIEKERERDRERAPKRKEWRRNWTKQSEKYKRNRAALKVARRARYPERYSAVTTLNNHFRLGKIDRPSSCACSSLGNCGGPLHAHHEDYSRPLHFVSLCRSHHFEVHKVGALRTNDGGTVLAPPKPSEMPR